LVKITTKGADVRAVVVTAGQANSVRLIEDAPEPRPDEGAVLVEALAVGVCGTDREIIAADYGTAPPGTDQLILGHESLGRVVDDPTGTLREGDLVAGIVRQPDPVPCPNCAVGEWDMCRNGRYTEHGIKGLPGFARDRWRIAPEFAIRLDAGLVGVGVLLEPTSVVAKAWDHIERVGSRSHWAPRVALVTGAGPIGLLAALLATQRGLEVHVLDRVTDGPKPMLVTELGATYHTDRVPDLDIDPDVIVECTGAPTVVVEVIDKVAPAGVVCLAGVSAIGGEVEYAAGSLNRAVVLENNVIFGSVNANRRHWTAAAGALEVADQTWLAKLITRRVPVQSYADAYVRRDDDVKVVMEFAPST
jgi:threonine dehydrogenase-like Zn-dependent dehydrogenase